MSKVLWVGVLAIVCAPGWGQGAGDVRPRAATGMGLIASGPVASVTAEAQEVLAGMAARAGVIFAGHVIEIARNDGSGFVDIRFRVDEPVLGCNKLGVYVLREWAGLWSGEAPRYRLGQRLLMLLTARGASGMSAPVDGNEGMIPIAASAVEPLADAKGVAPAEDGSVAADIAAMTADLRWVQARAVRPLRYTDDVAAPPVGDGPVTRWGPAMPIVIGGGLTAAQPTVGAVLSLLRAATNNGRSAGSVRGAR